MIGKRRDGTVEARVEAGGGEWQLIVERDGYPLSETLQTSDGALVQEWGYLRGFP